MSQPALSSPSSSSRPILPIAVKPTLGVGANPFTTSLASVGLFTMASTTTTTNVSGTNGSIPSMSTALDDGVGARPQFSFQFSAATQMILKRLRGEGGPLSPGAALGMRSGNAIDTVRPPGYDDVRRSVLQGMKTTLNMDIPASTPTTTKRGAKPAAARTSTPTSVEAYANTGNTGGTMAKGKSGGKLGKAKVGTKRKRVKDESDSPDDSAAMSGLGGDSDSDGASSTTHMPKQTLSGRKVVKPAQFNPAAVEGPTRKRGPPNYKKSGKSVEQALCKRCGRGHSPASNMIVFCDGCNLGWHQMCHDPMISDDLVKDEGKEWFCKDCAAKRAPPVSSKPEFAKEPSWPGKNMEEKRAYLSTFPHSHLVSLLLHAITMHPDIPIHPAPASSSQPSPSDGPRATERRVNVYPQQPFPPSATSTAGLFSRAEANPSAPINFIRKIPPGGSASPSSPFITSFDHVTKADNGSNSSFQHASSAPPTLPQSQTEHQAQDEDAEGEDESRESTPASPPYPKPGNGLMAKLPPDDQDLEWLVGEGEDEAAFSHVVFDRNGEAQRVDERDLGRAQGS